MTAHSRHPVGPPPQAPARESSRRLLLRAHAIVVVIVMFASPALSLAFGFPAAAIIGVLVSLGSIAWWVPRMVRRRFEAPFPWRRLPWAALGYVLWAVLSLSWSQWPHATALTALGLLLTTGNGLFLASTLSWREFVKVLASGLKWIIGASVLFELYVSLIVRAPIFPPFFTPPAGDVDPQLYWSRDNLLDGVSTGGRIQGVVGNANLLAAVCLIAIIVFAVRLAAKSKRRGWLVGWIVVTAYLFFRAASATAWIAAAAAAVVLATVLIMRTARTPRQRTARYAAFFGIGAVGVAAAIALRDTVFALFGRGNDLTGRGEIWAIVLERANERPVAGWGFSSPWVPWDPGFHEWIIDHDQTVMQAHDMWIDVYFQLGLVGVAIVAVAFAALLWRSWFFAVDRPRWDIVADRPYARLSVLPILLTTVLLVQGLTESNPVMLWGWMLVIALSFKIKASPIVGIGPDERVEERGHRMLTRR